MSLRTPVDRSPAVSPSRAIDPMRPHRHVVADARRDTADTFTFTLTPKGPEDALAAPFRPGQFAMIYAFGVGEAPISMSGDPARPAQLVHTIREVGAVTRDLARLRPGATVGVRGPFGTAWPLEPAEGSDVVIVAGGIGLAPLRPAILALLAHRERYGRVALLVGARTPGDVLYRDELEAWATRDDVEVHLTVDRADAGWPYGEGLVTELIPRARFDARASVAMVCGPEVMMRAAATALQHVGVLPAATYLSLERSMKCGYGHCGHCQFGPYFVCRDGPVFRFDGIERLLDVPEV